RTILNPSATEAKRIRLRGELGISRKTIAQGMSDALRCPVYSCASPHSFCTRDRGCSAHPAFPAPSSFERCGNYHQTSGASRRETAELYSVQAMSLRAQRSNPLLPRAPKDGLLRGACHRARVCATRWLAMTIF